MGDAILLTIILFVGVILFNSGTKEVSKETNIEKCEVVTVRWENTAKEGEQATWEYVKHVSPIKDCTKK